VAYNWRDHWSRLVALQERIEQHASNDVLSIVRPFLDQHRAMN
jgi:hypothetical protein